MMKNTQITSLGKWQQYYSHVDFPVAQCFESARHLFAVDADLFEAPPAPYYVHHKVKREEDEKKKKKKESGWQCNDELSYEVKKKNKRPKAVDEDLYRVPPELLLSRKHKRGMMVSDFWRRCFGLSCIP